MTELVDIEMRQEVDVEDGVHRLRLLGGGDDGDDGIFLSVGRPEDDDATERVMVLTKRQARSLATLLLDLGAP